MKELVLLGPTASGKTSLAVKLAHAYNAVILSLDSLSIYRYIDIASAKPTKEEREGILHFGIDVIDPDEVFNVTLFFDLYQEAKTYASTHHKNLIIVGGTSFYLKAMLSGLSDKPRVSEENLAKIQRTLRDMENAYETIQTFDPEYAAKIASNDTYRMEKWYEIYYETGDIPSAFLKRTLRDPIIKEIPIFEIETPREILRKRIVLRTEHMLQQGLINEIVHLERRYGREPNCMKAIGIKEVLAYLDGIYDLTLMKEKIITNTARLAKRQRTFNKTQFTHPIIKKPLEEMFETASKVFTF